MIVFACPRCSKKLQVKDELAGRQAKCPQCGQIVPIPAPVAVAQPSQPSLPSHPESIPQPNPSLEATAGGPPTAASPQDTVAQHPGAAPAYASHDLYDFLATAQGPGELGRLGPYRILKVLGVGGMGVVFHAEDPHLERSVALKAMKPSLAASETARKRFLREAKAMAAIKHDHIVTIFQVGEDRGAPFLAMEFLEGEPLDERLKREKQLPLSEVLRIGREIAEGLAAAHKRGLIHRDIKPGNIWLEGECRRVKILDFGLALAAIDDDAHLTQSGCIVGTPAYMAPEQAQSQPVDARCDLFSLGCVLYRLSTGELPFKGASTMSILLALAQDTPKPARELNADVPPPLSDLITKLLAKNRDERPASAQAVVDALRHIEREQEQTMLLTSRLATEKAPRPPRRKLPLAVAAAVLLVGILVLGAVITFRTKHGTLVVNVTEPDVQVLVDGEEKLVVDSKKVGRVELIPGEHKLTVKRGEEELYTESFSLKSGGEVVIDAKWTPKASKGDRVAKAKPSVDEAWLKAVGAMPAQKQVEAVTAKLKELNPGFDGKIADHQIEDGVVTELSFLTDNISDISPVRALAGLHKLGCPGSGASKGKLSDLSAVKDMKLTDLDCHWTKMSDLAPLKDMKLSGLNCSGTKVADLAPLKDMRLIYLNCDSTQVSDAGLTPLKEMPLYSLHIATTKVSSLVPLRGMALKALFCDGTEVSDLSPLQGMPLEYLACNHTRVVDLSPLKTTPLQGLLCDFKPDRDAEILRSIKTLETINYQPALEFWKRVEAQQGAKKR